VLIADNLWLWAQIGALAFFGSLAVSGFMSIAGLGDASDGRSAHKGIIPTAGGLGVLAGLGLALCAVGLIFPDLNLPLSFASLMALVFAIGMLGLIDDVLTLGAKMKFGIMLMICGAAVWLIFHGRRKWHDGALAHDGECGTFCTGHHWRVSHNALAIGFIAYGDIGLYAL